MSNKDFLDFLNSEDSTSSQSDNLVLNKIKYLDKKENRALFSKVSFLYLLSGVITLAICPQFGLNPFGASPHVAHSFMKYGMWTCGLFCGSIFFSIGVVLKFFILNSAEIIKYRKNFRFGLTIVASTFFVLMGIGKYLSYETYFISITFGVFWILGGYIMELGSLGIYNLAKTIQKRSIT